MLCWECLPTHPRANNHPWFRSAPPPHLSLSHTLPSTQAHYPCSQISVILLICTCYTELINPYINTSISALYRFISFFSSFLFLPSISLVVTYLLQLSFKTHLLYMFQCTRKSQSIFLEVLIHRYPFITNDLHFNSRIFLFEFLKKENTGCVLFILRVPPHNSAVCLTTSCF